MPPYGARDASPQGGKDGIFPINHLDMALTVNGFDDVSCHSLRLQHHGVMEIALEQVGIDETWANVSKTDFQVPCIGLLLQSLQIIVLESLGR